MNVAHSFVAPQKKIQVAARMSAILLKALVPSVPALPRGSCRTEHSIGRHYFIHPGFIPLSSNCQNGDMLDMSFMFFSKSGENFQKVLLLGMFVGACRTIPKLNGQRSWTCSSSHSPPPQWEGPPSRLGGEGHGARMTQVWCFLASSQG